MLELFRYTVLVRAAKKVVKTIKDAAYVCYNREHREELLGLIEIFQEAIVLIKKEISVI